MPASAKERRATPAQAVAMVKKAVAAIRKDGREKAYAAITNKRGGFVRGDLYITVWGLDGVVRAHGANANMVGKNLGDLRDIDGKLFIQERFQLASAKGKFWQEYKYTHPQTGKIEPKRMYCESLQDTVVCGGVYKDPA
ncbi:cache domain-containing protein [Piscinibacter sp. HJYY11]|nr:cache domain-containing protein [Piscinibacter sp. HJYY11]